MERPAPEMKAHVYHYNNLIGGAIEIMIRIQILEIGKSEHSNSSITLVIDIPQKVNVSGGVYKQIIKV